MLEGLRRHAPWIIIVIAAVFILSMAIGGISSIFVKNPYKYVGVIEGVKITYPEYQEYLKATYANYIEQNPDTELDDQIIQQLNDQTWNQLVQRILFDKEIKKRRIKVSEKDVIEALKNPPDDIKQWEQLHTDGQFDIDIYNNLLFENPNFAAYMEQRTRGMLPYDKLYEDVRSELILTEEQVREEYFKENDKAKADIIFFEPRLIDTVEITAEDLQEYYEKHIEDYKRGPARKYKFVKIDLAPSEADKIATKAKIDSLYNALLTGEDFEDLARRFSHDPSAPKGGDLGYFEEGKMVPEFSNKAFSMKVGDLSEPVESQFGWHIIKVTGKRNSPEGKPMVKASHILLKNEASDQTKQNQEFLIYDLYERAQKIGLEKAAAELAYEVQETREFYQDAKFISGIGRDEGQVEFAFSNKVGKLYEPFKSENDSYFLAEISYNVGDHYLPLEDVESRVRRYVEQEKKLEKVFELAEKFVSENSEKDYFEAARKADIKIVEADGIVADKMISGIRFDSILNETILNLEIGQLSSLIKGEFGAYIALVKDRQKPDMELFETQKEQIYQEKLTTKKEEYLNNWYKELLDNAKIVDSRNIFFNN